MIPSWRYLYLSDPGPLETKLERLPEVGPSVYGFYLDVRLRMETTPQSVIERIQALCSVPHGPERRSDLWPYESLLVTHKSPLEFTYLSWCEDTAGLFQSQDFMTEISAVLAALQDVLPPLYVGETHRLRDRIREHLTGGSDLLGRLEAVGIKVDDLVVRHIVLEGVPSGAEPEERADLGGDVYEVYLPGVDSNSDKLLRRRRRFFEELVTRLCKPRFIHKLGGHQSRLRQE